MLQLARYVSDEGLIYYGLSAGIFALTVLFIFTIKDSRDYKQDRPSFGVLMTTMKTELSKHLDFTLAILASITIKVLSLSLNQFGSIIVTNDYKNKGLPDDDARNHLSLLFLLDNLLSIPCSFGIGYLTDRIKSFKLLFITSSLTLFVSILMIIEI